MIDDPRGAIDYDEHGSGPTTLLSIDNEVEVLDYLMSAPGRPKCHTEARSAALA